MKKTAILALISFFLTSAATAADDVRKYQSNGEVLSVEPVYSQIKIEHGAIKGFAGAAQSDFYVASTDLLKGLAKGDLVDFEFTDTKGDVRIESLKKTGVAPVRQEGIALGTAVHDTLQGVGQVAKTLTSPIPPVSEAVGGAMDSTADVSTEARIKDGEVKQTLATF